MEIRKERGQSRRVYMVEGAPLLDRYVVKVPIINFKQAKADALEIKERQGIKGVKNNWKASANIDWTLKGLLFFGINENRREARMSRKHRKSGIVAPTWGLPGGILNIQPKADPIQMSKKEVENEFVEELGVVSNEINHTTDSTGNFGYIGKGEERKVRITDGGGWKLEEYLDRDPVSILGALARVK